MASPNPAIQKTKTAQLKIKVTTIDIIGGIFCSVCKTTHKNKIDYDQHYIEHIKNDHQLSYSCVLCYQQFSTYSIFRGHCYTRHVSKSKFQCKFCFKRCSKKIVLDEHEASHIIKCPPPCNLEFSTKEELLMHKLVHKDNGPSSGPPYPCRYCDDKINNTDSCEMHLNKHVVFTYTCPMCSDHFDDRSLAIRHLSIHFGGDTNSFEVTDEITEDSGGLSGILCCYCEETFKFKADFDDHFQNEHEDGILTYTCTICENQYEIYSKFSTHVRNHSLRKKFKCDNCNKVFSRVSLLVTHVALCDQEDPMFSVHKPFQCQRCDQRFMCDRSLSRHMRDVHRTEEYRCLYAGCGDQFETMKKLVLHQLQHEKISHYCRECGLHFKSLSTCERHVDVHVKRSYSCPICQKRFGDNSKCTNRYRHIQQHFQVAYHVCKICSKVYEARHRLMMHMKTHREIKNFACGVCGKGFVTSDRLNAHSHTHTGVKPYKCVACDRAFTSYPNWYKHVKNIHRIDPRTVKNQLPAKETVQKPESGECSSNLTVEAVEVGRSSPNLLEEAYMFVQGIEGQSSIELENIDPSILDELPPATVTQIGDGNADQFQHVHQENVATVSDSLVPEMVQANSTLDAMSGANYPCEFGPDFISFIERPDASGYQGQAIDLDDHFLPHIDPMLTFSEQNNPQDNNMYIEDMTNVPFDNSQPSSLPEQCHEKWEPPIITRIYQNYSYSELPGISSNIQDVYRSVMQTDIY